MDLRSAALLMMSGGSGVTGTAKELEIWDNGDYEPTDNEKAEGIIAYDPLHVIVMPGKTRTFGFTENGTYSLTPMVISIVMGLCTVKQAVAIISVGTTEILTFPLMRQ